MVAIGRHLVVSSLLLLSGAGCAQLQVRVPLRDRERAEQCNTGGLRLVAQGDFAQATREFQAAVEADPLFGPAHCNLGVALLHTGRLAEAAWQLDTARRLLPGASAPLANLGLLYETVGRYGRAEDELRAALELAPEDIEIIGHLARVHVRQKKCSSQLVAWLDRLAAHDDDPAWRSWAQAQLNHMQSLSSSPSEVSVKEGR